MDRGIWATWYDLGKDGRDDYLDWLHGIYLPRLVSESRILWAGHYEITGSARDNAFFDPANADDLDIGTGTDYLLLVGAEGSHAFFNPNPRQRAENFDHQTKTMMARRIEARSCIFTEEVRVEGPAIDQRPANSAPGPAIQMGTLNMKSIEDEYELGAWYAQDRLPAMAAMEGCICTRKLVSTAGWAKHSVLYEFTDHEKRHANFTGHERDQSKQESWSVRVINNTIHAPGSPSIGNRIWPVS